MAHIGEEFGFCPAGELDALHRAGELVGGFFGETMLLLKLLISIARFADLPREPQMGQAQLIKSLWSARIGR